MSSCVRVIVLGSLVLVGCASPMSDLRKDNRRLTGEVAELRADRRALDRKIKDLEHQIALARDGKLDPVVPQLPVEVVAPPPVAVTAPIPDGGRLVGVADDGGEIIYEGDAAAGKAATLDDDGGARRAPRVGHAPPQAQALPLPLDDVPQTADRLEVTHHVPLAARATHSHVRDAATAPGTASPGDPASEYRSAADLVRGGQYDAGVTALRTFLTHYPRHEYANNAQYWIGEAFYAQKNFTQALTAFRATIESYPHGNKAPDAMLKLGYCYLAMGEGDKGRAELEQLLATYPKSEPAALATKRLEAP
jgi:tol-pal system protein YbgF